MYRTTRKAAAARSAQLAEMRAAKERKRLEREPPAYPAELPEVRMRITVEQMDFTPTVHVFELRKTRRVDVYDIRARLTCWWFGCSPIYEAEHHGSGTMPCERCGAPDTTYSDRVGDTRHARMVERLRWIKWRLLDSWRPQPCPACGKRGTCKPDCDGIPF